MEKNTVADVVAAIEKFAPLSIQEKWDNSGLCIGNPQAPVTSVLLALDCTPELVDEAVAKGADMIVTHHPLIFSGLKRITPEDQVGLAVMKAVAAGIAVYSAHTTADKVIAGVSGAMAARLGLLNVEILDLEEGGTGLGTVGDLPEPLEASDVVAMVKERFGLKMLRCSKPSDRPVKRIAMCGGAGASLIPAAVRSGADLFITADVSYHHFFTQEGFMIMDIGHYESEKEIVDILFSLIKKNFPNFAVRITENIYSNPIFYF
ncbi:MAG: Nif3-like dinuclear metal center hexameric protein [Candidatus Cryptobacteroides sp.]